MNEVPTTNCGASEVKRRIPWIWIILLLVAAIIAGISRFELWLSTPPGDVVQADKGFKKAKETISPEALRAWALEEISKYPNTNNNSLNSPQIPNSEIPNYVQTLFAQLPEDAWVNKDGDQTYVKIFWGGPFFHWTFEIGSTNYVPPVNAVETAIKWVPGIYFTREDK